MDDHELVARCLAGDRAAFESLIDKYQSSLLSMTWAALGNREDARDAAQQAFLAAFTNLASFDHGRSFKNWLFAIAWKDCLDMKRREKTRRVFLERLKGETPAAPKAGDGPLRLEQSEAFGAILMKLDRKERLALSFKMNEGYSASEIAEVLGCSESSARVYVFNAVRKVRTLWKEGRVDV